MKTSNKIFLIGGIGGILAAIVIGGGLLALSAYRNFAYPAAPAMPDEVNESMPAILSHLEGTLKTKAPHVLLALQPGLSPEKIAELEKQTGVSVPDDIKAIYQWHDGMGESTNHLNDFIPGHCFRPLEETLAAKMINPTADATLYQKLTYRFFAGHRDSWVELFGDLAGDGYWYDPKRKASEGAVFFNLAETGDFTFFPSARNLMAGIDKCYEENVFQVKTNTPTPTLDEDFKKARAIWDQFGVSRM